MALSDMLKKREKLTTELEEDPHNIELYLSRCKTYASLDYPDLACMDAYKVLLLVDEVLEDSGEWHEDALDSIKKRIQSFSLDDRLERAKANTQVVHRLDEEGTVLADVQEGEACLWAKFWGSEARIQLVHHLTSIGCLRSAYDFIQQIRRAHPESTEAAEETKRLAATAELYFEFQGTTWDESTMLNPKELPERGWIRREIYPWNHHEEDRTTTETLQLLNEEMHAVAPHLEIRVTELPLLYEVGISKNSSANGDARPMLKQLGVFAMKDLAPGDVVLHERSLLTANSRLHEPFCDACSSLLPSVSGVAKGEAEEPIPCQDCDDTFFCSQECHDLAQESYHPAVCGIDIEPTVKDVPAIEAADALYTTLLLRAIAMAQTQNVHPLQLRETKYIWGDFTPRDLALSSTSPNHPTTLPFTFSRNILLPLHMLSLLSHSPFTAPHNLSETWLYNTLYAKFRGTASARLSTRDGRPEVAAVHPLWCLANHSCDPNVSWEWAGDIEFVVRKRRRDWTRGNAAERDGRGNGKGNEEGNGIWKEETRSAREGGIKEGEELLNYYVDIDLSVKARREWGVGPLGGDCRCERCIWEAREC